jgi:transcriptional regulator with XRE-family HTH domain
MSIKKNIKKSNIVLGKHIERLRLMQNMSRAQLGREINKTTKQVIKYECGEDLIPLSILENIAYTLDEPIGKRLIRKMSIIRKIEIENDAEMPDELIALYNEALPDHKL